MKRVKTVKKRVASSPWRSQGGYQSPLRPRQEEKPAPCGAHCPLGTNIRGALSLVAQRQRLGLTEAQALDEAWRVFTLTNPFPATIGRICPHPCEDHCNRSEKDGAVAISALERFVGDWGLSRGLEPERPADGPLGTGPVAVVGAGPSGLSCAYHLARAGHRVTVYESLPQLGGMLRYGVPSYRLSRAVLDGEIDRLRRLDVVFHCSTKVGGQVDLEELRKSNAALFVGIGAHRGRELQVPGEEGPDLLLGVDFLHRANAAQAPDIGPKVVVVGDGQTAIDVALMASRLGRAARIDDFSVLLLRAHTASEEKLDDLGSEGVQVAYEAMATAVKRDYKGRILAVEAHRAILGDPSPTGLRLPSPIEGTAFSITTDTVIAAVSQCPDWDGLGVINRGSSWLNVDDWGRTPMAGVWSGGDDVMLGNAALSIHHGMRAAWSIDATLRGQIAQDRPRRQPVSTGRVKLALFETKPPSSRHTLTVEERIHNLAAEIDQGISYQQALYEAGRCLSCGACSGCERCWMFCTPGCFSRASQPGLGRPAFDVNHATCDGCRKCADECPTGYIEMS